MKVPTVTSFCDECFRSRRVRVPVPDEQADTSVRVDRVAAKVDLCGGCQETILGPLRRLLSALGPLRTEPDGGLG